MKIYHSAEELIGKTPLIRLHGYESVIGADAQILGKWEAKNPAGSAKDRAAREMLADAEARGLLRAGGIIIEPTSGNTGIGLASLAAAKGYRVILTMPDTMSRERIGLLAAYGAEIVLTPGKDGMAGAIARAEALHRELPGSIIAGQFVNPANPAAHYRTTGPELWEDTDGRLSVFVAGIGTGGTITGVGRYLKEKNPDIRVIGVEPADSPLLSKGYAGAHGLQGIGANFVPEILDRTVIDEIITVTTEEAYRAARLIAKNDGILVGITSGAAVHAAGLLAARPEYNGALIAAFMPDTGERYLSTGLFGES